jgi:hypothetical protein
MTTTAKNALHLAPNTLRNNTTPPANPLLKAWNNYWAYADRQGKNRMFWYCTVLLALPCGFMMPMAILMMFIAPAVHIYFIGLLILLLFANVVMHVAQVPGRIFIPLFHATVATMTFIPFVAYLMTV